MLSSEPNGLVDGHNPVKSLVCKRGMHAFGALIVGVAAFALSRYAAPECAIVPPGCTDKEDYCHDPNFGLDPMKDCHLLAKYCMSTCGCCSESPKDWCPNKVATLHSIITDDASTWITFIVVFMFLEVFVYWRLCCSSPSAQKKKVIVITSLSITLVLLVFAGVWVEYQLTDCQNHFRGFGDVLLIVSFFFFLYAVIQIIMVVASFSAIAHYAALLAKMADLRNRRDPNILVLDVSADHTRRFLAEEEQLGAQLTVQVTRNRCQQCCRIWRLIYFVLAGVFVIAVCYDVLKSPQADILKSRGIMVTAIYVLVFILFAVYARILRTQAFLDHKKHQNMQKWISELQGPQQLLLFYNVPGAMQEKGGDNGVADQSVISFSKRRAFFFVPPELRRVVPGTLTKTTHTRIIDAHHQTGDVLEFQVVAHQQNVRAEAVHRIPLEPDHVAQVRRWLQDRNTTFEFETGPEIELLLP